MSATRTALRRRLKTAGLLPATAVLRGPDLRLRLLHARFMEATQSLQDINDSGVEFDFDSPEETVLNLINDTWWEALREAIPLRAKSPEGLRVKVEMAMRGLLMMEGDPRGKIREDAEDHLRLAFAALKAVRAMMEALPEGNAA
jgi:hypothetical protein